MTSRNANQYPLAQQLLRAAAKGDLHRVIALIEDGATLAVNKHGRTPLHIAAHRGLLDIVRVLLQSGCSPDYQDDNGDTALQRAVSGGHILVVKRLLDECCSVDRQNNLGDTALHEASRCGLSNIVKLLVNANCNIDCTNKNGDTALHMACANGRATVTRLLASTTNNLALTNSQGDSPLHLATRFGHGSCLKILIGLECPLNTQNKIGNTALHIAVVTQNRNLCRMLVDASAEHKKVKNKKGKTPLDLAKDLDNGELAYMLISGPRPAPRRPRGRRKDRNDQRKQRSQSEPRENSPTRTDFVQETRPKSSLKRLLRLRKTPKTSPSPQRSSKPSSQATTPKTPRKAPTLEEHYREMRVNPFVVPQLYSLHRDRNGEIQQTPVVDQLPNPTPEIVERINRSIQDARREMRNDVEQTNSSLAQRIQQLQELTEFRLRSLDRLTSERIHAERTLCLHRIDQRAMYERSVAEQSIRSRLQGWMETRLEQRVPNAAENRAVSVDVEPQHLFEPIGATSGAFRPPGFETHAAYFATAGSEPEARSIDSGVGTGTLWSKGRTVQTGSSANGTSAHSSPRTDTDFPLSNHLNFNQRQKQQKRVLTYTPPGSLSGGQSPAPDTPALHRRRADLDSNLRRCCSARSWHAGGATSDAPLSIFCDRSNDEELRLVDLLQRRASPATLYPVTTTGGGRGAGDSMRKGADDFNSGFEFRQEDLAIIDQLRDFTLSQTHAV